MKNILRQRLRSVSIAVLLGASLAVAVNAAEPDIPPVRSGPEPTSISEQVELAAAYLTGRGVKRDNKLAAYWYEKAAEAGDPQAQKQIGYFYQIGLGVSQDPVRAFHWYQLAAAGGLLSAKVNLGVSYLWGVGTPKNVPLGIRLFREAAEKGNSLGACYLGDIYYMGIGVDQDKAQGLHWYERAAKEHDPRAEFDLASILSKRDDPSYDLPRAIDLLRHSAGEGFVASMHSLGLLLVNHPELAKTPDEPLKLLDTSSKAGNWRSSAVLGVLEREGRMVPIDANNAYYHFKLATLQGGQPAIKLLAHDLHQLEERLAPQDAASIDEQAHTWYQQQPMSLEFIYKDGENWKRFPAFALANPEAGSYAGRLVPTSPF
jgi:uncharacterized protein